MAQISDASAAPQDDDGLGLIELLAPLIRSWKTLLGGSLLLGSLAFGGSFLVQESFTSRTTLLPPQQQRSAAAAAFAQLGALSGLAGVASGFKSPADQYAALLQSTNVTDRIIDQFKLQQVYDVRYRFEARRQLAASTRISAGKKDGLITIEVDDHDKERAANIATHYVEELRRLTGELALTEAQQRRAFFERQVAQTRDRLTAAQRALQSSGFNPGALQTDARTAAESYARVRAELTSAEVRARILRERLTNEAPELKQALATIEALRSQLARMENPATQGGDADYVGKFREFKYQETLFDMFAKQFELARLDESNEGTLIQVVDVATPAEHKSYPKRATIGVMATFAAFVAIALLLIVRSQWRYAAERPGSQGAFARLQAALKQH